MRGAQADAIDTPQPRALSFLGHGANVVAQALLRNPGLRSRSAAQLAGDLSVGVSQARAGIASLVGMTKRIASGQGAGALRREPSLEDAISPFQSFDQAQARYGSAMGPIVTTPYPNEAAGLDEAGAGTAASDLQDAAMTLTDTLQQSGCTQSAFTACSDFQSTWNSSGGSPQITVDGQYGPCTAAAVASVLGSAPASCFAGTCSGGQYVAPSGPTPPSPAPPPSPNPTPPAPTPTPTPTSSSSTTWLAVAAAAIGGYLLWRRHKKKGGRR